MKQQGSSRSRPKVGIYYYPWYDDRRWNDGPVPFTPAVGRYHSTDPAVVGPQFDVIQQAGVDYVILELVPPLDWCFSFNQEATELAVGLLRERGMGWTFLIDSKTEPGPISAVQDVVDLVDLIERRGWTDRLVDGPSGMTMLMHYSPLPDDADEVTRLYRGKYQMVYPVYLPHWREPDEAHHLVWAWVEGADRAGITVHEYLTAKGYVTFWQCTEELWNHAGFCAVEPGYDDMLLGRDPQLAPVVDRRDGDHYRKRIRQALATNPEHLLIYSWNEYFEGSCIEPTEEYGSFYVDLTRELI